MSGTPEGGRKAAETLRKRNPKHYQDIGHKGGSVHVPKGFSMATPEVRSESGRKGGGTERKPREE